MKRKPFRRALTAALSLSMVLALFPTSAFAVTTVTPNTGSSSTNDLQVEYFSSTLYNWDEDAANAATAEADKADSSTVSYTSASVSYSQQNNYNTYTSGSYYVLVNGEYYVVTDISCTRSENRGNYTYSWTVTYSGGTVTGSDSTFTLYQQSTGSTSYEGKGFYFTSSGNKGDSVPSFSLWSGTAQNYYIYSGLAASKLSESSNVPFNDNTVNAANLFATDGSNTDYTDVYTNVQVPFVYDSATGYYTLDSDQYAVYFANGTGESGATMEIADKPAGYSAYVASGSICGFAPFNAVNLSSTSSYVMGNSSSSATTTGYTISGSMNYGFGMVTSVDFQMTDDGQINGEDIVFEFSGDDDVWVYIDGVLVLDIGGTHDAINGKINFRTGDVTLTAPKYGMIGDKATDSSMSDTSSSLSQTNLYTALETTLTGFSSEGTHTMTIYYMDRGQGATNCLIKFNLPQEDSLSVTKEIADTYTDETEIDDDTMANLSNIDFSFTLYNGDQTVANENYSLYDADGNFVQTGSTDSAGTFTLKNGYTAVFNNVDLDEEGSWYVVENLSSTRWKTSSSYTATINGSKSTDNEGTTTSGTVSLTGSYIGSDLSSDSIVYTFTNQYVKGADPDVDVYDETIVLDYGLPVEVDVTANDITTLYGASISEDYKPVYDLTLMDADNDGKYTGTYGYAEIKDDKVVYTLTEDFCGIETVQYKYSVTVTVENDDGNAVDKTGYAIGTLTIIPATSVYYEEDFSYTGDKAIFESSDTNDWNGNSNFITIATGYDDKTATFSVVDDGAEYDTYQETGLVGTTTDSTYGTDAIYLNNLHDSYGTTLKVDTSSCSAQYKYTFTGMGTAIYGRVSSETGYIRVTVTDSYGTVQDTQYIDTINLVTKTDKNGEETILDETLYNIPIYMNTALGNYDTYTVRIYVYAEDTPTDAGVSGGEFYLDGVRVYNPMGSSTDDNSDYETANSAYATDGEANMAVINIRQKVVSDYDDSDNSNESGGYTAGDNLFTLTDVNGEIGDFTNYNSIGPNEEFYLDGEGYTLSFALVNWSSTNYKLYLGMKAPSGEATSATFNTYDVDGEGTSDEMGTIAVNNSSDCYYDISSYVDVHTVTVYEDDDDEEGTEVTVGFVTITSDSDNLLALTNIKVTGTSEFDLGYSEDIEGENESDNKTTQTLYAVSTAYAASLFAEEEEEEVSVFEPDSISVSCSYSSKTRKATVTVVTSKDVSYVTIDGTKITGTSTSGGKMKFSKTYTKVTKGTEYEVIAYDADSVASAPYTTTAQ